MRRRLAGTSGAVLCALAVTQSPTGAQEQTGISGRVESVVELSLQQVVPGRIQATVSATVPRTRLSVSEPGRSTRVLGTYGDAVLEERVTVRSTGRHIGARQQTITFGPQSP